MNGPPWYKAADEITISGAREEAPLITIVGGVDVHRAQITFDYLKHRDRRAEHEPGPPATRPALRQWFDERFAGSHDMTLAVEGCTGWRFVVEEMMAAGVEPHLAEPADTAAQRGRKKRAKTDRADARRLCELLGRRTFARVMGAAGPRTGSARSAGFTST